MSVNNDSWISIDSSRVQIVASLTDGFRGVIYINNIFKVKAT